MAVGVGPDLPPEALSFRGSVHECQAVLGVCGGVASRMPSKPLSGLHPQSCLEFSLRIQEFIELIRQNKRLDAVR